MLTTDFPKELQPVFSVLVNYYNNNDDVNTLTVNDLANLFFASVQKDKPFYEGVFKSLSSLDVSNDTSVALARSLVQNRKLQELSVAAYELTQGKGSPDSFQALLDSFKAPPEAVEQKEEFITDSLESLISQAVKKPGLRWRLKALNKMLGSLRKGDFGFVFARPETGKTTFLSSEVTYFVEQLKEDDGPILWINNEEQGEKVKLRNFQSLFGVELAALYSDIPRYDKEWNERTNGKLKLFDGAQIHKNVIQKLAEKYKPSLIIIDQIDKITGFDSDRDDLKLGAIYQWFRELAKMYCPIIGVCQADASGEGVQWLTMANVANAKTAKQAEADWILGIGCVHKEGMENIRFLNISKNKLFGDEDSDPRMRHGKIEVLIEPLIARYKDLYD